MFPKGYYFYTIWTKCVLGAYAYQELVPGQYWSCNLTVGCCQIEEAIVLSGGKSFNGLFSLHSDEEHNDCMSDNNHNLHQPGWEQCRVKINFFMHARSGRYLHTFVCKLKLSQIIFIFNNPIVVWNVDAESILFKSNKSQVYHWNWSLQMFVHNSHMLTGWESGLYYQHYHVSHADMEWGEIQTHTTTTATNNKIISTWILILMMIVWYALIN